MFTRGRIDSGGNPRDFVIIDRVYFCKRHVDACVSNEIYMPRRPFVDSLSSFARFSSGHCGKISHFRFECVPIRCQCYFRR